VRNAWYVARSNLGDHPLGFPLLRFTPQTDPERMTGPHTDVCIDAFPRSGNTYAVMAFKKWNPGRTVAHHMHVPMQVRQAARLGIPCAVPIRPPLDATSSLLVYYDLQVTPRAVLASYIRFHRGILPVREKVAICPFEDVLGDPASLVRRLNRSSRADFRWEDPGDGFRTEIEEAIRRDYRARRRPSHTFGLPSAQKESMKARAKGVLAEEPRLAEATALYETLLEESSTAR
jgi:hypothetical protein